MKQRICSPKVNKLVDKMAPKVPEPQEAHTEFDFGLDFVDEFDAL